MNISAKLTFFSVKEKYNIKSPTEENIFISLNFICRTFLRQFLNIELKNRKYVSYALIFHFNMNYKVQTTPF